MDNRFVFSSALPEDRGELLEILEEGHYGGRVSLLFTRRDDAFASLAREGDEVEIMICRDTREDIIAAMGVCAVRNLYVNGRVQKVGYLFGLKTRTGYRGSALFLHRGYDYFRRLYRDRDVVFFLMSVLEENPYAVKLFEKRRSFMPDHHLLGGYRVHALKTNMACPPRPGLHFRRCDREDVPRLVRFIADQGRRYQFFPVIDEVNFPVLGRGHLTVDDFYILQDDRGEVLACGARWDQKSYKQYRVAAYRGYMKWLALFSRLLPVFGYPHMLAPVGATLDFFKLSLCLVKDDDAGVFAYFLRKISRCGGNYPFFTAGFFQGHPLGGAVAKLPSFSYPSKIYLVDWDKSGRHFNALDRQKVPYLDIGTL